MSAIVSGSFDPITNGHVFLVKEALALFGYVYVVVAASPAKSAGLFTAEERLDICREVFADTPNVLVIQLPPKVMLVDYAADIRANVIVRGLRNATDFEYEQSVDRVQRKRHVDIRTIYLLTPREYTEVSSSLVRNIYGLHGWENVVSDYVPAPVMAALTAR